MTTREIFNTIKKEDALYFYKSKKTDKEIYDILVKKGLTDSFETYTAEAKKISEERYSQLSKEELLKTLDGFELSDEELSQIAGGKEWIKGYEGGWIALGTLGGLAFGISAGAI